MAPMMGPKLAPTMVKNPIRLAATPVIASRTPTAPAAIVLDTRGTLGIMVLKLLPAINAQKHAAGMEAIANRNNMAEAMGPPIACTTSPKSQLVVRPLPWAPATARSGSPPATITANVMPTSPPQRTSFSLRAFMPKSAPAAPAAVGSGHCQERQPAGHNHRERDAYQSAPAYVLLIARVHAEIRARRARRGEEPDHDGDHHGECAEGILLRRRHLIIRDATRGLKQDRKQHEQRNGIQEQGDLGHILNALGTGKRHATAPQHTHDSEGQGARLGCHPHSAQNVIGGEKRADGEPADLQHPHQQAQHDVAAGGAEGGAAYHVQRKSGFHAEHGRNAIVKGIAEDSGHGQRDQAKRQPAMLQRSSRHLLIECDPEEDSGVCRRGIGIPRRAFPDRVGHCFGKVVWQHGCSCTIPNVLLKRKVYYTAVRNSLPPGTATIQFMPWGMFASTYNRQP